MAIRFYLKAVVFQPNNPGALFSIDKDEDGNHFCTASFQSNYAIYSGILSDTEEEAMSRAALEVQWLFSIKTLSCYVADVVQKGNKDVNVA